MNYKVFIDGHSNSGRTRLLSGLGIDVQPKDRSMERCVNATYRTSLGDINVEYHTLRHGVRTVPEGIDLVVHLTCDGKPTHIYREENIVVNSKIDIVPAKEGISTVTGEGMDKLITDILSLLTGKDVGMIDNMSLRLKKEEDLEHLKKMLSYHKERVTQLTDEITRME
jgi:hypothetical protein